MSDIAENAHTAAGGVLLARQLAALTGTWAGVYHVAVRVSPAGQTWTALPERAAAIRVITASSADDLAHALYRDAAAWPPPPGPSAAIRDSRVALTRAACPGWAVVACGDGVCAACGGVLVGPMLGGVVAQVKQAEHDMALAVVAARRSGSWQWRRAQRQPGAGPAT